MHLMGSIFEPLASMSHTKGFCYFFLTPSYQLRHAHLYPLIITHKHCHSEMLDSQGHSSPGKIDYNSKATPQQWLSPQSSKIFFFKAFLYIFYKKQNEDSLNFPSSVFKILLFSNCVLSSVDTCEVQILAERQPSSHC